MSEVYQARKRVWAALAMANSARTSEPDRLAAIEEAALAQRDVIRLIEESKNG